MEKKIIFLSDTHEQQHNLPELPEADFLIHCGDATWVGDPGPIAKFGAWMASLKQIKHKIFVAGNHDIAFEEQPAIARTLLGPGCIYLQDELLELDGLRIYGSPWQPFFCSWAFNIKDPAKRAEKWAMIPQDLDILITHGPPCGRLDGEKNTGEQLGCQELALRVMEVQPRIHAFGHIHEGYGVREDHNTTYINASIFKNSIGKLLNSPLIVSYDTESRKILNIDQIGIGVDRTW